MQEVLKNHGEDQQKGDFRARIEAIGPSSLKIDTVAFGYIKNSN